MAIPKNKEELKSAIQTNYAKLYHELTSISPELTRKMELPGHVKETNMSVSNLVSYLLGWGELLLKWISKGEAHLQVDFPETGYKWNELGNLAQKFYTDYQELNYEDLCKNLNNVVFQILTQINLKSNAELYEICWYEKWTLGRMIQFNTASPYSNATARIRKWKKEKDLNSYHDLG